MMQNRARLANALYDHAATTPEGAGELPFGDPSLGGSVCVDFRVDACDCKGAEDSLATCALTVTEVRTPLFLIVAAGTCAFAIVLAVVAAQIKFGAGRCIPYADDADDDEEHGGDAHTDDPFPSPAEAASKGDGRKGGAIATAR